MKDRHTNRQKQIEAFAASNHMIRAFDEVHVRQFLQYYHICLGNLHESQARAATRKS